MCYLEKASPQYLTNSEHFLYEVLSSKVHGQMQFWFICIRCCTQIQNRTSQIASKWLIITKN